MAQEPDFSKKYAQVIAKAWMDPAFKQRLIAEPTVVLRENGIERPPGVSAGAQIRVVENSSEIIHLVLPPKPSSGELSDEQLGQVAGGQMVTYNDPAKTKTWGETIAGYMCCW